MFLLSEKKSLGLIYSFNQVHPFSLFLTFLSLCYELLKDNEIIACLFDWSLFWKETLIVLFLEQAYGVIQLKENMTLKHIKAHVPIIRPTILVSYSTVQGGVTVKSYEGRIPIILLSKANILIMTFLNIV